MSARAHRRLPRSPSASAAWRGAHEADDDLPPYLPPNLESDENIEHSLFGEILDWMLAPLLLLWPMSIAITYLVAKSVANEPFDRALEEGVSVLAQQLRETDAKAAPRALAPRRELLRSDEVDTVYFQIAVPGALFDGDPDLPAPPEDEAYREGTVVFRNESMHGNPVRIAHAYIALPAPDGARPGSAAPLALVQVAETLGKRAQLANNIVKGVILPELIIFVIVLALVWFALARGLSPLAQLQQRIRARRPDDLSPIDARQVPEEILPLVSSLNDMLARLAHTIAMQKRFIADAAHQMRTPLAGMRMQSELALRQGDPDEIQRSLEQLAKSSESSTRLVNQLLALARAEHQPQAGGVGDTIDLDQLARSTVQEWVSASFADQIDLGFETAGCPLPLAGNALMLHELLSNLIDNALRYTPGGGSVTVRVRRQGQAAIVEVEDTGPGIPAHEREQVFERFYRILGSTASGSGLGLAIVREIAQQHGAHIELFDNPRSTAPRMPGCLVRVTFSALPHDAH
ncbi:MAG: sensor histidine kinase N-terminal domain-containing protein [Pseudomonadota bacterium]